MSLSFKGDSFIPSLWILWLGSKESAYNVGDLGSIPGSGKSPGEGNDNPLQYSCLENSTGQRSLADYSPWGHKESDMTEWLHYHWLLCPSSFEHERRKGWFTLPMSSLNPTCVILTLIIGEFWLTVFHFIFLIFYCGVGRGLSGLPWVWFNVRGPHLELEDSWESLGLQGDPTSPF